jgi:SWI/SNF-related matrix-associated actin-dependent regulator of chromatin subfamily A protein 2/4
MFDQKSTGTERKQFLHSILTQDEADDEEENEAPDDETINLMIARSPDEIELFNRMDIERDKLEENRQDRKTRLIEECELPDWLLRDDDDVSFKIFLLTFQFWNTNNDE